MEREGERGGPPKKTTLELLFEERGKEERFFQSNRRWEGKEKSPDLPAPIGSTSNPRKVFLEHRKQKGGGVSAKRVSQSSYVL